MLNKSKLLMPLLFASLLEASSVYAALPAEVDGRPLPSLAAMLERAMPAVVNISTSAEVLIQNPLLSDPFFRHFFQIPDQPLKRRTQSLGSGVIIDKEAGYVLTNHHVVDKADVIMVTLQDGRQLDATLVGADPESDVAVIHIPANNLTELPVADSNRLRVGDFVVAIGNPFGLGQTATSGIISALGRSGLGIEGYEDFIQTDASINPGNSGGALVNLRGELIGINTAIVAPSGGNVGIGFAIPSNMAMKLKDSLVEHGEVRRGLLGVTTQDLTDELAKAFNLTTRRGAVVNRVAVGSPAERAGLEPGDIIVSVNGREVKNSLAIRNIVGLLQVGDKVEIELLRGGARKVVTAVIGKAPQITIDGKRIHSTLADTVLGNSQRNQVEGVVIEKIDNSSYAFSAGLRPGDIIVSANRYRVKNIDELKTASRGDALLLNLQRGNEAFFLLLQ